MVCCVIPSPLTPQAPDGASPLRCDPADAARRLGASPPHKAAIGAADCKGEKR
jgi:hypothetical protein